jgi:Flp pilus assembly protein CpaB
MTVRVKTFHLGGRPDDKTEVSTFAIVGDWTVTVGWVESNRRMEPASVEISASARPVTAVAIRQLPLGEILGASRRRLSQWAKDMAPAREIAEARGAWPDEIRAHVRDEMDVMASSGPQRGKPLTAEQLDEVADVYRAAWAEGRPVNEAVREALFLSKDGASKRIMAARRAGLLDGIGRSQR